MEYLTRWLHHTDSSDSWVKAQDMGAPAIDEFRAALASRKRRKPSHAAPLAPSRPPRNVTDLPLSLAPPPCTHRKRRALTPAEQPAPQRPRAEDAGSSATHAQLHIGTLRPAHTQIHPMPTPSDKEVSDGPSRATLDAAKGTQPLGIHSRCDV